MGWILTGTPRAALTTDEQPQQTLGASVVFSGPGLHSGLAGRFEVSPAPVDYGIRFDFEAIGGQTPTTTFFYDGNFTTSVVIRGARIMCVEHLMSAFHGLGITNAHVRCIEGDEFPILDGSAREICSAFAAAKLEPQAAPKSVIAILSNFSISDESGDRRIDCSPGTGLNIKADIEYKSVIGRQSYALDCTPAAYAREIAGARTFLKDPIDVVPVEEVRAKRLLGLADPCQLILYTESQIISELRFPDEPVRHKILDFLGDIYTLGYGISGQIRLLRSGHALNLALAETIAAAIGQAGPDADERVPPELIRV